MFERIEIGEIQFQSDGTDLGSEGDGKKALHKALSYFVDGRVIKENAYEVLTANGWTEADIRTMMMSAILGRILRPHDREFKMLAVMWNLYGLEWAKNLYNALQDAYEWIDKRAEKTQAMIEELDLAEPKDAASLLLGQLLEALKAAHKG